MLEDYALTFRQQHNGSVAIFDAQGVFNSIIDDPTTYGFKDSTSHSNTDSACMWYDTLHPLYPVHKILARELGKALDRATNLTNVLNTGSV
jgi:phospholipase/lecithinase/hemolysin